MLDKQEFSRVTVTSGTIEHGTANSMSVPMAFMRLDNAETVGDTDLLPDKDLVFLSILLLLSIFIVADKSELLKCLQSAFLRKF